MLPLAGVLYLRPVLRGGLLSDALRASEPLQRFPETSMGASLRGLMALAIAAQAASWASNLTNRLERSVMNAPLDDALRHQMIWTNARRAWLYRPTASRSRSSSPRPSTRGDSRH